MSKANTFFNFSFLPLFLSEKLEQFYVFFMIVQPLCPKLTIFQLQSSPTFQLFQFFSTFSSLGLFSNQKSYENGLHPAEVLPGSMEQLSERLERFYVFFSSNENCPTLILYPFGLWVPTSLLNAIDFKYLCCASTTQKISEANNFCLTFSHFQTFST